MKHISSAPENVAQNGKREAEERDNPFTSNTLVEKLYSEIVIRKSFCNKYGLAPGGFEFLVMITRRWQGMSVGSTVYSLAGNPKNCTITAAQKSVGHLYRKGLIEVIGYGNKQARMYIPTGITLSEFNNISATLQ